MKRLPKRPRSFGRKKAKPYQHPKKLQNRRMSEYSIHFIDELAPGFAEWYRSSYDDKGKFIGQHIPGLFGQKEEQAMQWYIYLVWAVFGAVLLITALGYLYYLLSVQKWIDKYKSKDWRYDG